MIAILIEKANPGQTRAMLEEYGTMIKIVVDIRRGVLAGGGEMHADYEALLLEDGSEQDDLWGANWYPEDQRIEFEALINIRPRLGNRSVVIQSEDVHRAVAGVLVPQVGWFQKETWRLRRLKHFQTRSLRPLWTQLPLIVFSS